MPHSPFDGRPVVHSIVTGTFHENEEGVPHTMSDRDYGNFAYSQYPNIQDHIYTSIKKKSVIKVIDVLLVISSVLKACSLNL